MTVLGSKIMNSKAMQYIGTDLVTYKYVTFAPEPTSLQTFSEPEDLPFLLRHNNAENQYFLIFSSVVLP